MNSKSPWAMMNADRVVLIPGYYPVYVPLVPAPNALAFPANQPTNALEVLVTAMIDYYSPGTRKTLQSLIDIGESPNAPVWLQIVAGVSFALVAVNGYVEVRDGLRKDVETRELGASFLKMLPAPPLTFRQ